MTPGERRSLMERYRAGHAAVVDALGGVDLDRSEGPEEWTPRQIVHHLADATTIAGVRLRRLISESQPAIASYDEAAFARDLHYERPIETSLALFGVAIEASTELLESLDDDEWERTGLHDEYPAGYSIDLWLERQAGHVHEHAEQISRCRS